MKTITIKVTSTNVQGKVSSDADIIKMLGLKAKPVTVIQF